MNLGLTRWSLASRTTTTTGVSIRQIGCCLRCIRGIGTSSSCCSPNLHLLMPNPLERKSVLNDNISLFSNKRATWSRFNFVRTLTKHARRTVPFPLAQRLHQRFVGMPDIVENSNKQGVELIEQLQQSSEARETVLKEMNVKELISLLYALPDFQNNTAGSVVKRLYAESRCLDTTDLNLSVQYELGQRMKSTDLKTLLSAADATFYSQTQTLKFLSFLFDHILANFEVLSFSAQDFTSIMFFIYLYGDAPEGLLLKLEEHLVNNLEEFNLNQVGIISLGFFRANKRITNYTLLDNIAGKLLKHHDQVHPDNVTNILKTLRHSGFAKETFLLELAQALTNSKLKNMSSLNQIMHLAMVFASLKIYHEDFLSTMVLQTKILLDQIPPSKVRTKDLGRLIWALGTFNYYDEELIKELVVPIFKCQSSTSEKTFYPESFVDVAMGMAYLGVYSDDIVDVILSPKVAVKLRDHRLLEKNSQLLFLDNSVQIEHPDYKGNMLSKAFIRTLPAKAYGDIEREMTFRHGLRATHEALMKLLGKECVACHFILPHFHTADIEINVDGNNQPLPVRPSSGFEVPLCASPTNSSSRIAIELIGKNQCAMNCEMLLGNFSTKLRQLHKLGYTTHLIMPDDAKKLGDMTSEEVENYFVDLLTTKFKVHIKDIRVQ